MTVQELIKHLQSYPPEYEVVIKEESTYSFVAVQDVNQHTQSKLVVLSS